MSTLASGQRKHLKGLAHHLKPVVHIGQGGVTPSVLGSIDDALAAHELIKIKFLQFKEHKQTIAAEIEERNACHLVGIIGNVGIFFRAHPDPDKRKIAVPGTDA